MSSINFDDINIYYLIALYWLNSFKLAKFKKFCFIFNWWWKRGGIFFPLPPSHLAFVFPAHREKYYSVCFVLTENVRVK